MNISNIVVIRFSLKLNADWQKIAYGSEENRGRWFFYRMELFKDFMANSLRNQTTKPMQTFILMDASDEVLYRKTERYISDLVTPIFSENRNHFLQVRKIIKERWSKDVAISRVDSDDILDEYYFERVNKSIREAISGGKIFTHIVATRGYRASRNHWQALYFNRSPFLTRYCQVYNGENVYDMNHLDVVSHPHIQCDSARWVQVINSTNVRNALLRSELDEVSFLKNIEKNPTVAATKQVSFSEQLPNELLSISGRIRKMPFFEK